MRELVKWLVDTIQREISSSVREGSSRSSESRLIFNGPPLSILEQVYEKLTDSIGTDSEDGRAVVPVLLVYPSSDFESENPSIGSSGRCDESHLLHIRNDPNCPSFIALIPPGQHNIRSVESTTREFGVSSSINSIEDWLDDSFIQLAINEAFELAGISSKDCASKLVTHAIVAVDELDARDGVHLAAWHLLSRIFSISSPESTMKAGTAISLACGYPPLKDGNIDSKLQLTVIKQIAKEFTDGFRTGIERLIETQAPEDEKALNELLSHLQQSNIVPTAFERAPSAFYLPDSESSLLPPPKWWERLTIEKWKTLLEVQEDEVGQIVLKCTNGITPTSKGLPAIVREEVALEVSIDGVDQPSNITVERGSNQKAWEELFDPPDLITITDKSLPKHRTQLKYKVSSDGLKTESLRVVSLMNWEPGIVVLCPQASKVSLPKKTRNKSVDAEWEVFISLPQSGRHDLRFLGYLHSRVGNYLIWA